jgi:hypothetical protein
LCAVATAVFDTSDVIISWSSFLSLKFNVEILF